MERNTLHVVAHLQARPEKREHLRTLLLGLVAPTHREAGCLRYQMLENETDPLEFTFVEEWQDTPSLDVRRYRAAG